LRNQGLSFLSAPPGGYKIRLAVGYISSMLTDWSLNLFTSSRCERVGCSSIFFACFRCEQVARSSGFFARFRCERVPCSM
jgi:hypothetical protein